MLKKILNLLLFLGLFSSIMMPAAVWAQYDDPNIAISLPDYSIDAYTPSLDQPSADLDLIIPTRMSPVILIEEAIEICLEYVKEASGLYAAGKVTEAKGKALEAYGMLEMLLTIIDAVSTDETMDYEVNVDDEEIKSCKNQVGQILISLGNSYKGEGDFKTAIDLLKKTESLGSDVTGYPMIKIHLIRCYQGQAQQCYEEADIEGVETYHNKCIDYTDAEVESIYRDGFLLKVDLGKSYYYLGDFETAIDVLNEAEIYMTTPDIGVIKFKESGVVEVEESDRISLYLFRSLSYEKQGLSELALEDFKVVINKVSVSGKFSDVVFPDLWCQATMEYIKDNNFLYQEEDISATEDLIEEAQPYIREIIFSDEPKEGGGCFIQTLPK
ncbi:MAG: hypothetical protein JSV34_01195 [Candidatus Omnitrophota bacterium]|nr:MAG: hypothetical protein JSV34_01195 [Candidatus Omnitrophota bacterium]